MFWLQMDLSMTGQIKQDGIQVPCQKTGYPAQNKQNCKYLKIKIKIDRYGFIFNLLNL